MKVRKLLELQALVEERQIPCDMTDEMKYWSLSKCQWVSILDMDLVHVVRALSRVSEDSSENYNISDIIKNFKKLEVK